MLDQEFAFQWIQRKISLFGGDPQKVTISGESAGAGAVMYHAMAKGGSPGDRLFEGVGSALLLLIVSPQRRVD